MPGTLTKLIEERITLILIVGGLILIVAANSFEATSLKVKVDHLLAEIGALFLVVGTLHWMFESRLRKEMLNDIASTALGSARLYESGLVDCTSDAKKVSESALWVASDQLIFGIHYSPRYLEHIYSLLKDRCNNGKRTRILVVKPDSVAATYLASSQSRIPDIKGEINRIMDLINALDPNRNLVTLQYHQRILRYNFIYTEHYIWLNFLPNSRIMTVFPAIKIQTQTPFYRFFEADIKALIDSRDCETIQPDSLSLRLS